MSSEMSIYILFYLNFIIVLAILKFKILPDSTEFREFQSNEVYIFPNTHEIWIANYYKLDIDSRLIAKLYLQKEIYIFDKNNKNLTQTCLIQIIA